MVLCNSIAHRTEEREVFYPWHHGSAFGCSCTKWWLGGNARAFRCAETARVEANRNAQKISAAVLIASPTVPTEPARPRRKLVALATLIAALILSSGIVLGVEGFDDRFRSPRDVTRILRLPVLATFAQDP